VPRTSEKDKVRYWQKQVASANKVYRKWEERFHVDVLEEYYLGHQWREQPEDIAHEKYVINLVFPSIEIKIPSLMFYHPVVHIEPRPARADDPATEIAERAKLQEDTVNTFIQDKEVGFKQQATLCLKEAFFRFGVLEIGYSADLIDNPLVQKPELTDEEAEFAKLPKVPNPDNSRPETVYVKRVPAKQFRTSINAGEDFRRCDWVGYYEWAYIDDIKSNKAYSNASNLKTEGKINRELEDLQMGEENDETRLKHSNMVRIWKIWDQRAKVKRVFAANGDKFLLEEEYSFLPFSAIKFYDVLDQWLPLPPVYNWLSPQNELNETREMQRTHRKRFYRRYTYRDGAIDEGELRKLEDGGDGVYARANQPDPIQPVPDAPLDPAIVRNLPTTKQDFYEISGVGSEQRGEPEPSTTATQANIVDVRAQVRESFGRTQVAEWLAEAATILLRTIKDKMALPFWIAINVDPMGANAPDEIDRVTKGWITAKQIGDIQHDVSVDISSLSPVTQESERQAWAQVLGLLTNPAIVVILMSSDTILRKTLGFFGIRSEREIAEVKKAAGAVMMALAQMQQAKQGGPGQMPGAPGPTDTGQIPEQMQIMNQLKEQLQ
jgi:hypothetical protein